MIYITGDTHGEITRFCESGMPGESSWTKDDKLMICGDFGFVWYDKSDEKDYAKDQRDLDLLAAKPYDILFIDGNHENFDQLYSYPKAQKYGNEVHVIRDNIFHLQRGRIYTIEGKSFFTFGGAYSIDKILRREGETWWKQELPSDEEYKTAIATLKECGHKVDYIVTHNAPQTLIRMMGRIPDIAGSELTGFLDWVWYETEFKKWFFGHWHNDIAVTEKARLLWYDVEKI